MHPSNSLLSYSACLFAFVAAASSYTLTACNVTNDKIPLPFGQTNLTIPSDANPEYIAAGFGTQNYTCSPAGKYTSIGALAVLFDASCVFDKLQAACNETTFSSLEQTQISMRAALGSNPAVLGHHYFVHNPTPGGVGISPTFDFRADSGKGNPDGFVIASKIGDILSPVNPTTNVDWLELKAINGQGSLAKYVFRILTTGGQPPPSCTPGSVPIAVPYAANYWLFK